MSDFLARVTAEFDDNSIPALETKLSKLTARISNFELDTKGLPNQIDAELEKHKFTIHLNGIKMDNISTQGAKIGQSLSQNIVRAIQSGGIDAQIKKIQSSWTTAFNSTSLSNNSALNSKLLGMKGEVDSLTSSYEALIKAQQSGDVTAMVTQYTTLTEQMTKLRNNIAGVAAEEKAFESSNKAVAASLKEISARNTLSNEITAWMNQNAKAAETFGARLQDLKSRLDSGAVSSSQAAAEFRQIKSEAQAAGVTVNSFALSLGKMALQAVGLGSGLMIMQKAFTTIKSGINTVVDLDTSLIDLQKTAHASAEELNNFYLEANDAAKELGVTTQDIIQNAADFSRLGFNLPDAKEMSRVAAIFQAISPGMSQEKAMDGLVSTMKAFGIEAGDALDGVASKINAIGNSRAVDNLDLVEMLTRSSAAMKEANNTLDDTIALGTAAIEIVRNSEMVGTALRTISMRIRGKSLPPYLETNMLCA